MNNNWKAILIIFAIIIGIWLYFHFSSQPNLAKELIKDVSGDQFFGVQKIHYTQMPITWKFNDNNCGDRMKKRIQRAFDEITNETQGVVSFLQDNNSAILEINCIKGFPSHYGVTTNGEGGYTASGYEITKGTINFYNAGPNTDSGGCNTFMDIEIHEILHTFGYQHIAGYGSVMQPINPAWCNVHKIDDDIVKDLMETYTISK